MKYILTKENGEKIEATPEKWAWGVVYKDGTELKQFEEDGSFHRFAEIKQDQISLAVLYQLENPERRIDIPFQDGMTFVHKYRMVHADYFEDPNETVKIYVFGYEFNGQKHINFVMPNDLIVSSPIDNVDFTKFKLK